MLPYLIANSVWCVYRWEGPPHEGRKRFAGVVAVLPGATDREAFREVRWVDGTIESYEFWHDSECVDMIRARDLTPHASDDAINAALRSELPFSANPKQFCTFKLSYGVAGHGTGQPGHPGTGHSVAGTPAAWGTGTRARVRFGQWTEPRATGGGRARPETLSHQSVESGTWMVLGADAKGRWSVQAAFASQTHQYRDGGRPPQPGSFDTLATVQTPVPAPPLCEFNGLVRFARLSAVSEDPGQLAYYVDALPDGCVEVDPHTAKPVLRNVSTGRMWVVVSP